MPVSTSARSGKNQLFLDGLNPQRKVSFLQLHLKSLLLFAAFVISISNATAQVYREWTGTGNWTTGTNWNAGTYDYAQLEFKGNGNATSNNDANPASQWRLYFTGTKAYTITGNTVNLFDFSSNNSWILSQSSVAQIINTPIGFNDAGARTSWITTQSTGTLTLGGSVSIAGGVTALRIAGSNTSGTITLNGAITGSGKPIDIGRDESGNVQVNTRVFFNGTNTYSGLTTIVGGTLSIASNAALGSGSLTIGNGTNTTTLAVTGTTTRSQGVSVTDLSTAAVIDVASGQTFTLSGNLTGGATNSTKYGKSGSGTLLISGASNTYNGQIQIGDGTVVVQSSLGTNTSTSNRGVDLGLNVGDVSTTNNVLLQASNGVTVGQSIYVASNASGATRTISLNGTGAATFNNEIYTDGDLTLSGGSGTITLSGNIVSPASNKGIIITGGTVILSGNNTYTGTTTVNGGTLQLGAADRIANTSNIVLGGGTFSTGSGTGFSETAGTLNLGTTGTIALGTGSHTLTFSASNAVTWTGTTLTITGWAGTAGASGTAGKIFIGNSATGLTQSQLDKITFSGYPAGAKILSTGEIVPKVTPTVTVIVGSYVYNGSSQGPNSISTLTPAPTTVTYTYVGVSGTTYASSATPPTNAGSYTVTATIATDANYYTANSSATSFAISAAPVTITPASGQSKIFGAADPTFTYSASPSVSITGSLSRVAGENVGTYAYTLGTLSAGTNYSLSLGGTNTFFINAAQLTITGISANDKTFDGTTAATLSGTPVYNGLQNGDVFTVSGIPSANFNNAGPGGGIPVIVSGYLAPSTNYTVLQPGGLTANIIPSTPTASNNGPVCSGSTLTLSTATVSGATYLWTGPNSFTSTAQNPSISAVTSAAAGVYAVTVTVGGATSAAGTTTAVINPAITDGVLSGTTSICFGGNANLQVAITGGTAPYTVILNDGNTNVTYSNYNSGDNIGINGSSVGSTTYSLVSVTSSTGCGGVINPIPTATITVLAPTNLTTDAAPSSQTVLVNDPSPTNLTVTATGAALTYQWFSNGSNSNAGGTTVGAANGGQTNTFTPPTNVLGTKYYYAVVTGTCGTVTSSAVAVTITNTNTWKGGGTTNWSLGSNWTSGLVPTGANDAAIPVGNTPYPVLSVSSSINDLIIDPGATVGIGAGNTFTITGVVSGAGTISGSVTSNLVTSASTTINFTPGANTLKDLTVSAGTTTLSNALNITGGTAANTYGTVTVAPGATLASGGNLTIKSNQFGTARVAAGDVAGNYITGDVTVERYIPQNSKRAWRLLSVPTKGTKTIKQTWQENQAAGANGTPGFGTIITSNIATAAPLQAAGFDAYSQLPSMQSYNSATQGWVYVTSTNAAPIQSNKGYFLYIRGDRSVTTSSSTDAASATTLRTTGTLYQGNSNPAVSIAAGKFEPVGNTFASAIDFTSLSKTGGISNTFYVWDSKLLSGTTLGAYQTFNGSIGYTPATPGGSYPAGVPNTSIESGEAFMLGATGTAGTVTLVEASKTAGNQFTPFRPAALPAQFKTGLLKVTGSTTVLADNNIVVFDNAYKNAVDADDALKIQKAGETMSIVTDGKALIIDARQPVSSTDVISFNISNLQPQAYKLSFSTQNMNTAGLTAFVEDKYLQTSTAINLDGVSDYGFTADAANAASSAPDRFRVVFKKAGAMAIAATKAGFTISPNPVEGGVVNVQFKNQLAGKYSIRLLDAGGAVIFSTFATHGGGSSTQVLGLPGGVARGAYQLEITSPSKVRELQTLFINSIK